MVEITPKTMVQYPQRITNLVKRICGLKAGKYIITLTIRDDDAVFSVTEMGKLEK